MFNLVELIDSVVKGNAARAEELTRQALAARMPARDILDKALVKAMDTIGTRFARCEIFFPELLMAGDAMKAAVEILKPELSRGKGSYVGKYAIGTVEGDVHDIGKNIVIMMLEGNGWEVTDLGIDVTPQAFLEAVTDGKCDILGMGAYVSLSLPKLEETIKALKAAGVRDKVKVMIGGVPVTQTCAEQIGADAYGETAVDAVAKAKTLISQRRQ